MTRPMGLLKRICARAIGLLKRIYTVILLLHIPWQAILTVGLAVFGWWYVGNLNSNRDLEAKRRDITVQYLIEAYRRIEGVAGRRLGEGPMAEDLERAHRFEDALGDIQLLGSREQVQLTVGVVKKMVSSPDAETDMNPLLVSLRRDLRRELQLPPVDENLVHLRIKQRR